MPNVADSTVAATASACDEEEEEEEEQVIWTETEDGEEEEEIGQKKNIWVKKYACNCYMNGVKDHTHSP